MVEYSSISELTYNIKDKLENEFDAISVVGEISNFKAHVSGHWYFTLKDSDAQVSCAMWRGFNNYVFFTPENGMKIIVNGKITVYPPRGTYQIDVRSMKPAGVGELQAAFEKLKQKLSAEGLFDEVHKKILPQIPRKIGIVTAIGGAALRDMINIAERRFPLAELIIAPAKVQGEGAAKEIAAQIKKLNKINEVDVIIVGRGGGSLEDLWAFNEEIVARAIFASVIPVVSGVGHEIDFTISDFVADKRAPTPSAAIEICTPNKDDIFEVLREFNLDLTKIMENKISLKNEAVGLLLNSYGFRVPLDKIMNRSQYLDGIYSRINNRISLLSERKINLVERLTQTVKANNIEKTLKKGFTLIKQKDKFVTRSDNFVPADKFSIRFYDKEVEVK